MTLRVCPITRATAQEFVRRHHRHHPPQVGEKFAIGALDAGRLVGVAVVGRPVARGLDDGWTLEVTRLATDGTRNACSLLYGAAARAAKALGYSTIYTYTLASEHGSSLRASGWELDGAVRGRSWSCPSRRREDVSPTEAKTRWRRGLAGNVSMAPPKLAPETAQSDLFGSEA